MDFSEDGTHFCLKGVTSDNPRLNEPQEDRLFIEYIFMSGWEHWKDQPIPSFVTRALSSCDLRKVKTLNFILDPIGELEYRGNFDIAVSTFEAFVIALDAVEVTVADVSFMEYLYRVQKTLSDDIIVRPSLSRQSGWSGTSRGFVSRNTFQSEDPSECRLKQSI